MLKTKSATILLIFICSLYLLVQKNTNAVDSCLEADIKSREIESAYNHAELGKAIKEYKKLADAGDIDAYLNLAVIFKDLGYYDKAIKVLKKAGEKSGGDLKVLSLLGRIYYLNNQTDEAIGVLTKTLNMKPDDLDALINIGLCFEDKSDDTQAQKYFQKASILDRNNIVAHLSLADLYYRKDRAEEAINEYRQANLIDASIIKIQSLLGELFFKTGNLVEALKVYQKIKLAEPENQLAAQRVNEISAKLGRDFFQKEKEKKSLERMKKRVLVKPFPEVKGIVMVRVGLMQAEEAIEFQCSGPFEIVSINATGPAVILNGAEGQVYNITKSEDAKLVVSDEKNENIASGGPFVIRVLKPGAAITLFDVRVGKNRFWSNQRDRSYRGQIEISADDKGIKAINILNLEEYLYSVIPSEMPSNWPKEALKAQAVAARSEAMSKLGRHKSEGFDFCAEVHCQAYNGIEQETALVLQAVDETRGIILTYDSKPVDAVYSSNCGGHTQNNIFGDARDVFYLKGVFDSLENRHPTFPLSPFELEVWLKAPPKDILCDLADYPKNSSFRWVRIYTAQELDEMLNKISPLGEITKIVVLARQDSGHISALKIIGTKGNYILEKELNIRRALGNLRSSMFKVEVKYNSDNKPQEFIFFGGGWGHGVGMCQAGAFGMAKRDKSYKQILEHYFYGTEFKKLY